MLSLSLSLSLVIFADFFLFPWGEWESPCRLLSMVTNECIDSFNEVYPNELPYVRANAEEGASDPIGQQERPACRPTHLCAGIL